MTTETQLTLHKTIAKNILALPHERPLLVGIDGKDASGKTTFADNLATTLAAATEREVIRISLDDFFLPRAIRSRQNDQARGCYEDTFDISGIVEHLFTPIRNLFTYTSKIFDYKNDMPVDIETKAVSANALFILDGVFLQRPEFRKYWDYTVLLDVSDETAIARGAVRDTGRISDIEAACIKYINRYIASQKIYYSECNPAQRANIVIDNTDFSNPVIVSAYNRLSY